MLSGAKYAYPAPQDKLSPFDGAGLRSRLENYLVTHAENEDDEALSFFLFENVFGLALPTAREIVHLAKLRNGGKNILTDEAKLPLWAFVGEFCENEPNQPCIKLENGKYVDFFAFPVDNSIPAPSLCKAEDEFYTSRETKKGFEDKKRKLENAVKNLKKKQTKKLQETLERLKDAE